MPCRQPGCQSRARRRGRRRRRKEREGKKEGESSYPLLNGGVLMLHVPLLYGRVDHQLIQLQEKSTNSRDRSVGAATHASSPNPKYHSWIARPMREADEAAEHNAHCQVTLFSNLPFAHVHVQVHWNAAFHISTLAPLRHTHTYLQIKVKPGLSAQGQARYQERSVVILLWMGFKLAAFQGWDLN